MLGLRSSLSKPSVAGNIVIIEDSTWTSAFTGTTAESFSGSSTGFTASGTNDPAFNIFATIPSISTYTPASIRVTYDINITTNTEDIEVYLSSSPLGKSGTYTILKTYSANAFPPTATGSSSLDVIVPANSAYTRIVFADDTTESDFDYNFVVSNLVVQLIG